MKLIQWLEVLLCFAPCPFTLATSTMFILTCFCPLSLSLFNFLLPFAYQYLSPFVSLPLVIFPCALPPIHVPCPLSLVLPRLLPLILCALSPHPCPLTTAPFPCPCFLILFLFPFFPCPFSPFPRFLSLFSCSCSCYPFSLCLLSPKPFPSSFSHFLSYLGPCLFPCALQIWGNHPPTAGAIFKVKTRC